MFRVFSMTATRSKRNHHPRAAESCAKEMHYSSLSSKSSRVLEPIGLFWTPYSQLIGVLLSGNSLADECI